MEDWFVAYFSSVWGLLVTGVLILGFAAHSYSVYVQSWPASTGQYRVPGSITWSEFREQPRWLKYHPNEGLISYSYRVDGQLFTGTIPVGNLSRQLVQRKYYRGAAVDVFYSPRRPECSFVGAAPDSRQIALRVLEQGFWVPVIVLDMISMFIWFLVNV